MSHLHSLALAGLCGVLAGPVSAATDFTDNTFDLADYTITKRLQIGTADVSQTLTAGHPGAAMLADFEVPSTGPSDQDELGSIFYLNNGFTYDVASSGKISSIVFSIDKSFTIFSPPSSDVTNGQSFIIYQDGQYFVGAVALGSEQSVYHTAVFDATADDFYLLTDTSSGTIDASVHPSFSSGTLQFGFRNGFVFGPQTAAELEIVEDNFSVSVTTITAPVPEPDTSALVLSGIGLMACNVRRRRRRAASNTRA